MTINVKNFDSFSTNNFFARKLKSGFWQYSINGKSYKVSEKAMAKIMSKYQISKPELNNQYVAEALIFSGRNNPRWSVSTAVGNQLENIWNSLEVCEFVSEPTGLGYVGCMLEKQGRNWFVFNGIVVCKSEAREDKDRKFEKLLISTAPYGLILTELLPQEIITDPNYLSISTKKE